MKRAMEEKLTRAYRRAYDKNQLKSRSTRSAADEDEEQDVLMFPHGRHMRSAHETGPPHTHQGTFDKIYSSAVQISLHMYLITLFLLKVSQSQKDFLVSSILPKNERKSKKFDLTVL